MRAVILALTLTAPATAQQMRESPHHLLGISSHDPHALAVAHDVGIALDCQSVRADGTLEIVASESDLDRMLARGVRPQILQSDLESFYARRIAGSDWLPPADVTPPFGSGGMGGYFTLAEIESILDQFASSNPSICTVKTSIGTSLEGRDIWMVKISDNPNVDENEPKCRFDAVHHAREPMSAVSLLYYMDWLLDNYGSDPWATYLVDERQTYFIPIVNPDGYEYNRQTNPGGGGLWRKNRRNNGGGSFGVDLNRNYSFQWGFDNDGSSGNPNSETYRGPSPASEPETQAMQAFIDSHDFQTSNSAHSYSDLWLYAWGYDCIQPPDQPALDLIAQYFTEENNYTHGSICLGLYAANGNTVDYDYGVHDTFAGTIEIGSSSDGFWPSPSRIIPLAQENLLAYQRLTAYAGPGIEHDGLAYTESLGDGDGFYEPGEEYELSTTLVNPGVAPTPGSATLSVSVVGSAIEILDGGHDFGVIPAFGGTANNDGAPLRLRVAPGATFGDVATVTTELSWDSYTETVSEVIVVGEPSSFGVDSFETEFGWTYGVPSDDVDNGAWERANPSQTTSGGNVIQPENDHSPIGGLCAVTDGRPGSSAGTYDVDGGPTTLISPQFDIEDLAGAKISYWRWFTSDDDNDDLIVQISNDDGQSWTNVEVLGEEEDSWQNVLFSPASLLTPTDRMRMRFITADDPNDSLTEALIDDLELLGGVTSSTLNRYGTPSVGDPLRLSMRTVAPGTNFLLYAATAGGSFDLGGIGIWELDFASMIKVLNGVTNGNGLWQVENNSPNNPVLSGVEIHLQALVLEPGGAKASNAIDMLFE